ncbi:PKD domain-containing protein [Paraoerskovia marina]|uniref:PKD domain-containing protein n=1 Tax=Paraoerskovia marina TaxID=545619 RepID=A0A1H1NSC2_9CELL|nr:PKD domain-containing protein [Paraoerskovia marina]SDS01861.1 PKD domain-containing protein [Paraoerskovia marina]
MTWLLALSVLFTTPEPPPLLNGDTQAQQVAIYAEDSTIYSAAPVSSSPTTVRYHRFPVFACINPEAQRSPEIAATCAAALALGELPECTDDEILLDPLFVSTRDNDTAPWSTWTLASGPECIGPADLADEAARAFHEMQIQPATLNVQPPNGWTIVHFDTIVHTQNPDEAAQETTTELLGTPVQIRAQPTEYTWDFGDGTTQTTNDPGKPYPDHTITHQYTDLQTYTITLTTQWTGQYRITGATTWTDVPGTATTTSTSNPLDVLELTPRLVTDPLAQY